MDPKTAAILFVDVSGSTAFFDRYGEVAGHAMVEHCFKVIVPFVETHGGRIVKSWGDGFLAVFDGPDAAVDAAAVMHSSLADDNATRPDAARVRIHSGVSIGPVVVREDGDVFGDPVNVAARVQQVAGPGQGFVTQDVGDQPSIEAPGQTRPAGRSPPRRQEDEGELSQGMWKHAGATT